MNPYLCQVLESRRLLSGGPVMTVGDASVVEGNAGTQDAVLVVSLDAPAARTVTVNYGTGGGTAAAGADYDAVSGKLTFAPGETRKSILVPIRGDRLGEADETLLVKLRGAKNASVADAQGVVTVADDEPRLRVSGAAGGEGFSAGSGPLTFTVSLSAPCDEPVTVDYATTDGSATAFGNDFVAAAGTLTFAPGETAKLVTVQVLTDATPEPEEYLFLNLGGASANAYVISGAGRGTIRADDLYEEPPYEWWTDSSWYN